jgi:alkylhydroperoxidase family enzyme
MARIAPVQQPYTEKFATWLERTMPPGVPPLALFTTLARDERLFERFSRGSLLDRGHLTLRQREIVIDRTTARCGSEYEWGVHVAFFGERAGLREEHLHALVHGHSDDPVWSPDERLLVAACDALHEGVTIDDALWDSLRATLTEEAILEIVMLCGFYRTVSALTNVLQLAPEAIAARFPARFTQNCELENVRLGGEGDPRDSSGRFVPRLK